MSKNIKFGQICRAISVWNKIVENSRFCSKSKQMSILVKILENVYFSQNYQKDFDFDKNFKQISILVKIYKKSRISLKKFEKSRFW